MQPLRILHVTPYYAEAWAYGGIPRLAHSLARGLARRGHAVTVCTTDARAASARAEAPRQMRSADGVEVRTFANVSNRLAYRLQLFLPRGLHTFLRQQAASFDVAHLHACRNLPGAIAAQHLSRERVPYVLAPNGTALRIERRRIAKLAFDMVAGQRVLDGAARVLAVSEAERAQLASIGVRDSAVRLVPNPIDLDEFAAPPRRGAFRARIARPDGPLVVFLGKLTPRKRLDVVVRAFAHLQRADATLAIAGNDMGSEASTRSLVAELGIESHTVFTGLLEGGDRLAALADADVVVYPSEQEIFGLVPLEALLAGTPVVVADDSGCGEIVKGIGGGQVVPLGDADALADAVRRVLDDRCGWRAAASAAQPRIRERFGDDVVCQRIEALYREMVDRA
jgi:glycosyltransferase involved in cell wall biosynthesis